MLHAYWHQVYTSVLVMAPLHRTCNISWTAAADWQ